MDWKAVKFDWNRARAFLVTAEEGSLSAAARALGMAQPTLGRQVDALESELGVLLFERGGRGLTLTQAGLELLDHVRAMGEAAGRVSLAASGQAQSIEGSITITASEIHSAFLLPPVVARLRREQPGIEVEIVASNATIDLKRREADIAVRSFRPTQPDLIAKKIGDEIARLYAAESYLERIGHPRTPEELSGAAFIGFDTTDVMVDGLNRLGLKLTRKNFPVLTASHLVHWELVKAGAGIGIVPEAVGDREGGVRRVLDDLPPMEFPIWLTTHRELNTSRRVRLVYDMLAEELGRG
ncbi:LysR family transcriptional regulator [Oricola thermophila]|uniref:LysR family transcriptional regulator n=1 Tax=Oricola thermophila TaxID=2742145 RepID=A0A6N1VFJ6_9HYPH|nr:LysR family transcriptional regulator [Oricola thermophila]QKV19706.1 LysR family transcriptional regulator [Oricola thermophila]